MNNQEQSCDPVDFIDPKEATLQELYYLADRGVPEAKELVRLYDQEIDTVSGKASAPSPVIEWIEE
jgi:hypothetical protein